MQSKKSDESLNSDVANEQKADDKQTDKAPKVKKQKLNLDVAETRDDASGSNEEKIDEAIKKKNKKKTKAEKKKAEPGTSAEDKSDGFVDIGRNRRVELQTYKGTQSLNIREYYKDKSTDELKPGRHGITLNELEWKKLLTLGDQFKFAA